MKTVLSVLCWIGIMAMLSGCDDGDDGGSAGGYDDFPDVAFAVNEGSTTVTCFNADKSVITTRQTCIWNCAYYDGKSPRKVTLYFDDGALIGTDYGQCVL